MEYVCTQCNQTPASDLTCGCDSISMTLRVKDYCNCEHAHFLRKALEDVRSALTWPHSLIDARGIVDSALETDNVVYAKVCE